MKTDPLSDEDIAYIRLMHTSETVRKMARTMRQKYSLVYSFMKKNGIPMLLDRPGKNTKKKPSAPGGHFNVSDRENWMI